MPLFEDWSDDWAYLAVQRLEPIEEKGYLGQLEIGADEATLRTQYGGGKYQIQAKTAAHQIKNQRTIEIAGEPLFMTDDAEHRYRARRTPGGARAAAAAAAPAPGLGVAELLTIMQTLQQSSQAMLNQQAEAQREERRRQDQENRDREERRQREEEKREERRRDEAKQAAADRAADEKAERERQREHQQALMQLVLSGSKQTGAPIEAFQSGITTAMALLRGAGGGGGDDDDDDQGEAEQDPIMATIRAAVQGLVDGVKGTKETAPAPSSSSSAESDDVKITGPLADHVREFVKVAKSKGKNVDALLAGAVDVMKKKLEGEPDAASSSSSSGGSVTDLDAARRKAGRRILRAADKVKKEGEGEQQPPPAAPPAS